MAKKTKLPHPVPPPSWEEFEALKEQLAQLAQAQAPKFKASVPKPAAPVAACLIKTCNDPGDYAKGMCAVHYHRALRGQPLTGPKRLKAASRLPQTSVTEDVFKVVEAAAERNKLSLYRAVRWIVSDFAKREQAQIAATGQGFTMTDTEGSEE